MLKMPLSTTDLVRYVSRQLSSVFPHGGVSRQALAPSVGHALERLEYGFSHLRRKYYTDGRSALFDPFHTDQYAAFLYVLSHTIYRRHGDLSLAAKLYALNKALHAVDIFYEVQLPDIFAFEHPVGTVLGRATFSNYLFVHQGCSVGSDDDDRYPTIGEGVILYAGSALLGPCRVGHNCWLSAGARVMDTEVPPNTVVFGHSPDLVFRPTTRDVIRDIFNMPDPAGSSQPPEPTPAAVVGRR